MKEFFKKWLSRILSFLCFYFGWGVCLERASQGDPYIGVAVVLVLFAIQLWFVSEKFFESVLILSVAFMGTLIDSTFAYFNLVEYQAPYGFFPFIAPAWVTAIWVLYGMSLNHSFVWLEGKSWLSSPLGGIGGVLSYLAAEKVGAISFPHTPLLTLAIIGGCWAFLFPASLFYTQWLKNGIFHQEKTPDL